MKKRWIAWLLLISMIFSPVCEVAAIEENESVATVQQTYINPLYEDVIQEVPDNRQRTSAVNDLTKISEADFLTSYDAVVDEMCQQMIERNEYIIIYYIPENGYYDDLVFDILDDAMVHTGNPKGGDYLRYQFGASDISTSFLNYPTEALILEYWNIYYTNANQEVIMDREVDSLLKDLKLNGKSDFEKIITIYDYICANVAYDYEHLNSSWYDLMYTGYAALVEKKAVCQGYAVLLYRMMLEVGIDCRIIPGLGNGGPHAWNIIELDGKYFNVDSTWDAGTGAYTFFMRSSNSFGDHQRDVEYDTKAFHRKYPMANYNYMDEISSTGLPFYDVLASKWYLESVTWAYENGLLTGTSDTEFSPNGEMTRGMLVTVLYRKEGRPVVTGSNKFPDVPAKKYYATAITWASSLGLVAGYKDGSFGPEDSITREQIAKILFLYAQSKGYDVTDSADIGGFKDASKVSSYAKKYMQWAVAEGLIKGSNNMLNPKGNATRAEISAILKRFVEKYEI